MSEAKKPRWSEGRYTNVAVPSYIPPEALIHENGQFLRALLLRVLAEDIQRLLASGGAEEYFRNMKLAPEFNAEGVRTNTPDNVLREKRMDVVNILGKMLHVYTETQNTSKSKEIVRKIYFTPEQMDTGSYGAILGARGAVHKQMEKDTNCRIVLAGRGITNPLKDTSHAAAVVAMEDPHARIVATNEQDLQKAAERIEWILSDTPEATEFREHNRQQTAKVEGRYDPQTWKTEAQRKAEFAAKRNKRPREEAAGNADADLDDLLEGI